MEDTLANAERAAKYARTLLDEERYKRLEAEGPAVPLVDAKAAAAATEGTIDDFFGTLASQFKDPVDFKEAVIRDNEALALVGALLLTVAVPLIEVDLLEYDISQPIQVVYITVSSASVMLSLLGTTIAVRTILMVNGGNAAQTLPMLRELTKGRIANTGGQDAHPYNFVRYSLAAMLLSCSIRVYVIYGAVCSLAVCSCIVITLIYFQREELNFNIALLRTWDQHQHGA